MSAWVSAQVPVCESAGATAELGQEDVGSPGVTVGRFGDALPCQSGPLVQESERGRMVS